MSAMNRHKMDNKNDECSQRIKSYKNTRHGAGNRTRTCTLLAVEPKSTESTNSTMPAYFRRIRLCLLPIRPSGLS